MWAGGGGLLDGPRYKPHQCMTACSLWAGGDVIGEKKRDGLCVHYAGVVPADMLPIQYNGGGGRQSMALTIKERKAAVLCTTLRKAAEAKSRTYERSVQLLFYSS